MKCVILITPDERIEIREFKKYETIKELVDGWYEHCGCIGILDKLCDLYCNEEFLLRDDCVFNSIASLLTSRPIYGNLVVTCYGFNDDGEQDSVPFEEEKAKAICECLCKIKESFSEALTDLKATFSDNKPNPQPIVMTISEKDFSELMGIDEYETNN